MTRMTDNDPRTPAAMPVRDRSFALISDLPQQLIALLKAELAHLKAEFAEKAKYAGVGIGLFVVAAVLGFFALGSLVAAAILGFAVALPAWLAALIVVVALLLIAGGAGAHRRLIVQEDGRRRAAEDDREHQRGRRSDEGNGPL